MTDYKLSNIKDYIGNWAQSYGTVNYCGWMDLHVDEPFNGYKKGIWTIKVIDFDRDALFIHRKNGVFVCEELDKNAIIGFRYDRWHGLLPRYIAKPLEGKRYWKKCREYIQFLKEEMPDTYYRSSPTPQKEARIIWEFINE